MRYFADVDIMAVAGFLIIMGVIVYGVKYHSPESRETHDRNVQTIVHNGHEYLHFLNRGVVHNPDCPCFKKGE